MLNVYYKTVVVASWKKIIKANTMYVYIPALLFIYKSVTRKPKMIITIIPGWASLAFLSYNNP